MQQLIFGKPGEDAFLLKGYHIERELGRGGCGAVYLAKPQQNGTDKVAVKIMLSRAQADTRAIARFKREMDFIAMLRHRSPGDDGERNMEKGFETPFTSPALSSSTVKGFQTPSPYSPRSIPTPFLTEIAHSKDPERTDCLISKDGRYGGTFAHPDIAFEFGMWISPEFKIYLVREFRRLKDDENDRLKLDWKTSSFQLFRFSVFQLFPIAASAVYASEADLLNVALFGQTAKQWRDANPAASFLITDH
jgi:serine/threonine protein kinase